MALLISAVQPWFTNLEGPRAGLGHGPGRGFGRGKEWHYSSKHCYLGLLMWGPLVQGLGTGPAGVLAGTKNGRLCVVTRKEDHQSLRCLLEAPPSPGGKLERLATNGNVVVTGSRDGTMRVVRMDTP
jgi:hypothetical protein